MEHIFIKTTPIAEPLKVVLINPLAPAAQLLAVKILSGKAFGVNQLINLTLLVYFNEKPLAEGLKIELIKCAFSCTNVVEVSSDLPRITDYDLFCFVTNFKNPNKVDFDSIVEGDEQFDTLYLLIKVANNIIGPLPGQEIEKEENVKSNKSKTEKRTSRKPIFVADGLVAIDILKTLSKDVPNELFFCITPLPTISKSILAEYLKVQSNEINDALVWAANDNTFYVEFEKPLVIHDNFGDSSNNKHCDWTMIGKDLLESINLDHTQFSPSWMKKEFIDKIRTCAEGNPYGSIFKADEFLKLLKCIWASRSNNNSTKLYNSVGVISDGSVGTISGYPYVLPVIMFGDSWTVNRRYEEDTHLIAEIKRINRVVKEFHEKLVPFCKRFLHENVVNKSFIPIEESSNSSV